MNKDIRRTAELFLERNGTVEVRVIAVVNGRAKISSGYFNNGDALVKAVGQFDSNPETKGIYVSVNRAKKRAIKNLNQPIKLNTPKLKNKDIERYCFVIIDCDPKREKDTNSTEGELEAAKAKCLTVVDELSKMGFPKPVISMSGNGYHALYAVDLPVEDMPIVRDFLKALDHKFSDDEVDVDITVYSEGQIIKLTGTMTRKGPDTEDRPQRRSTIESMPADPVEVTKEQLQSVIERWGAPKKEAKPAAPITSRPQSTDYRLPQRTPIDVEAWFRKAGVETIGIKHDAGSTIYKLKYCIFIPEHKDNDAAIILGADGVVRYQCFHNSCEGRTFGEACNALGVRPDEWSQEEPDKPLPDWPVMDKKAYRGFAGDFVDLATCNSEADPAAVLMTFLVRIGVEVGATSKMAVGDTIHKTILACVIVGSSSKARKGTSAKPVEKLFLFPETMVFDQSFKPARTSSGPFSSGEGIIHAVRDKIEKWDSKEQKEVVADPGVEDKRLFVLDEEFGGVLANTKREGNTLSMIIRQCWDGGTLDPLTKNNKIRATGGVVGWVSHITLTELGARLSESESFNGFANRILWCLARRQKLVPIPAPMPRAELEALQLRLIDILKAAANDSWITLDAEAREAWCDHYYADLTKDRPGLAGCATNRGEAQALRLAMIYCLLDGARTISLDHLEAGIAVWDYCRQSANYIFAGRQEDATAQRIIEALHDAPLTQTEIHKLFSNNLSKEKIRNTLKELTAAKQITETKNNSTGGRPSIKYEILTIPNERNELNEITPLALPQKRLDSLNSLNSLRDNKKPIDDNTQVVGGVIWEVA